MHNSAPNIAECFRCSLFVYEWWEILHVSLQMFDKENQGDINFWQIKSPILSQW